MRTWLHRLGLLIHSTAGYVDPPAKFTFDDDERILINRKDAPYPKDLEAAKQLWRERLRFEYLQERLGKIATKKKPEANGTEKKADAKLRLFDPDDGNKEIVRGSGTHFVRKVQNRRMP